MSFLRHATIRGALVGAAILPAGAETVDLFENFGDNTVEEEPPVIDARAFANYGNFEVYSSLPFDTLNTLYYTNRGVISGLVGFDFLHISSSDGSRSPALNFVNETGSLISVYSQRSLPLLPTETELFMTPAIVRIMADDVVNSGLLSVAAPGLLRIEGDSVDLSYGGIEVRPIEGLGSENIGTNFLPDVGVFDNYWGGVTNLLMGHPGLLVGFGEGHLVQTPIHVVTNSGGFSSLEWLSIVQPQSWAISNQVGATNIVVQAVFAQAPPGIELDVRFSEFWNPVRKTALVRLRAISTNVVSGGLDYQHLYLTDELAWNTNWHMAYNDLAGTFRPAIYEASRLAPLEWSFSSPADHSVEIVPELFYQDTYSNNVTTNVYAAYSPDVLAQLSSPVDEDGYLDIGRLPGRIEIHAGRLDLRGARFRGEGLISINAEHVVGSDQVVTDGLNYNFNLGSTSEVLEIKGLATDTAHRFGGSLQMFSTIWTNQSAIVEEIPPDPDDDPPGEPTTTTNFFETFYHVLVVDAQGMQTEYPAYTHDFVANGRRVVLKDDVGVVRGFGSDAESLVVEGELQLYFRASSIVKEDLPNLAELEVKGVLDVLDSLELGSDEEPLERLAIEGKVISFQQNIHAEEVRIGGSIQSSSYTGISARNATLDGASMTSGGLVDWKAGDLRLRQTTISATRGLRLQVEGALTDSGSQSGNLWELGEGFALLGRPSGGSLMGTAVSSVLPRFSPVKHVWAAEDRGPVPAGYEDNLALGRLYLSVPRSSLARFLPADSPSALYVEVLELDESLFEVLEQRVEIAEGMTLYYAHLENRPAESLDGALGGRLRWVRNYAGPHTTVEILQPGSDRPLRVNRSLAQSLTIDSDADGTANGIDPVPFGYVRPSSLEVIEEQGARSVAISWEGAAMASYLVERRQDLVQGGWEEFRTVRNDSGQPARLSVSDPLSESARFYRVSYLPE